MNLLRQLPDQALHLQAEQRDGHGGAGQAALADHVVDADLFMVQRVIDLLLIGTQLKRRQDARLAGGGRAVAGWEQVFELAQDVFHTLAELVSNT